MIICDYLTRSCERDPSKISVSSESESIDYAALLSRARRFSCAARAAGLRQGDRVVLFTDNSVGYVVSYFGVLLAGGVVVGQSTANKERHLKNIINHCEAAGVVTSGRSIRTLHNVAAECPSLKFLFYDGSFPRETVFQGMTCRELGDIYGGRYDDGFRTTTSPDDLAQIIYTSGTTGNPKGVMLSHKNLRANTESIIEYLKLTPDDRAMVVMPFYYSYGNSLLLTHIACSGSLVIDNRFAFPRKILERMAEEEATGFAGVPSTFAILLHKAGLGGFGLPSLRYVTQAGGAMSPALTKELRDAVPGADIYIMYGQTEASARLSYLEPERLADKLGTIGKAIPGVTLDVKNEKGAPVVPGEAGEIVARGDNIMMGYWKNPRETQKVIREDGLHTGDLATVDDEGFIYIVSRKSDMIKSGAHRISPKEIEEVIMEDDRVHEVAVVGEPDPVMGETIVALVVSKAGARLDANDLSRLCNRHLPLYKMPKRIEFKKELPKTASGKIKRDLLRRELNLSS